MSVTCAVCASLNPDGSRFCNSCGSRLAGSCRARRGTQGHHRVVLRPRRLHLDVGVCRSRRRRPDADPIFRDRAAPRSRSTVASWKSSSATPSSASSACRRHTKTIRSERSGPRSGSARRPRACPPFAARRSGSGSGSTLARRLSGWMSPQGPASASLLVTPSTRRLESSRSHRRWASPSARRHGRRRSEASTTRSCRRRRSRARPNRSGCSIRSRRGRDSGSTCREPARRRSSADRRSCGA